jgi:hypothetical protein
LQFAQRFLGFEMRFALFENSFLQFVLWVFLFLQFFVELFKALGNLFVIGKDELEFEVGGIAEGIDAAFCVGHAGVVKYADDVGDGIDFAERGQRIAHAFFLHAA